MACPESRILDLAASIYAQTRVYEQHLREAKWPSPSFDPPASSTEGLRLPEVAQTCREELLHDTVTFYHLLKGPSELVRWMSWGFLDTVSLGIINNYGIAKLVPVEGSISLEDLQKVTSLDPVNLVRVLRHAMTNHVFREPIPGHFAHTAASLEFSEDVSLQAWTGFVAEDILPAGAHTIEALRSYPEATSQLHTGFNVAFDTIAKESMFATLGRDSSRAKRMGDAMKSLTQGHGFEVSYFVDNYDMSDIANGTFVDIGGSYGFSCVALAKRWPKMKFVVQDTRQTVESAPQPFSDDDTVAQKITLQAHDFFTEQPVKGADVYYFRWIMHNWSTPYAVRILRALIPALKSSARIVINDFCFRAPGSEKPGDEKVMRSMDMVMMVLLNAQERDEKGFRELFLAADERFKFKGVTRIAGCKMSVIEAIWEPGEK